MCRICKGEHFTSKCPYKDTLQPLDEIASTLESVKQAETGNYYAFTWKYFQLAYM